MNPSIKRDSCHPAAALSGVAEPSLNGSPPVPAREAHPAARIAGRWHRGTGLSSDKHQSWARTGDQPPDGSSAAILASSARDLDTSMEANGFERGRNGSYRVDGGISRHPSARSCDGASLSPVAKKSLTKSSQQSVDAWSQSATNPRAVSDEASDSTNSLSLRE